MRSDFLLYGVSGYVGSAMARDAVQRGLRPILAGRRASRIETLAAELGAPYRVVGLDDPEALDEVLADVPAVLHCAGPFMGTSRQMVDACIRTGTHYVDISGEIPVYEALAARDAQAQERGVMLLPGVGFDVVPTDCLAVYLKEQLPSATQLSLAFLIDGPAGMPPGTARTLIELIPFGSSKVRKDGRLIPAPSGNKKRMIDFGTGPVEARMLPWGDVFMAYYSTGIPNIVDYAALPAPIRRQLAMMDLMRPLFRFGWFRSALKRTVGRGASPEQNAVTRMHVWGEATNEDGQKATARLHGPEGGLTWTVATALTVVQQVLGGDAPVGFQTPAKAYGADLVLQTEGVTRESVD